MRGSRFSIRWLMALVAIVALLFGGMILIRSRRAAFLKRSGELRWSEYVERHGGSPEAADYCDRLARKYEYAARHPWLPVALDPPEPHTP